MMTTSSGRKKLNFTNCLETCFESDKKVKVDFNMDRLYFEDIGRTEPEMFSYLYVAVVRRK